MDKINSKIVYDIIKKDIVRFRILISKYHKGEYFLKHDKGFVLSAIQNSANFEEFGLHFKNDKEIVLEAVKHNREALEYVSEELKNNKQVVLCAIRSEYFGYEPDILKHASEQLRDDKEVVLAAVGCEYYSLKDASERLKDDKDIVLTAIKHNANQLKYASERLKNDREIVLTAVEENGQALDGASEELKSDKDVVLTAIKSCANFCDVFKYVGRKLRDDKEVVMFAVNHYGMSLEYVNKNFRNDKDIVLCAVNNNGKALQYASERLMGDEEIVFIAVKKGAHYQYSKLDDATNEKLEAIYQLVRFRNDTITTLNWFYEKDKYINFIKNNDELIYDLIKNYNVYDLLFYANENIKNDKQIIMSAIEKDASFIKYASENLKADQEIVLYALSCNFDEYGDCKSNILQYISEKLKNDKIFISKYLDKCSGFCSFDCDSFGEEVLFDKEILLKLFNIEPGIFRSIVDKFENDHRLKELINDKCLMMLVVKKRGDCLKYLSDDLKSDKEIVLTALKNDGLSLQYASENLKNDKEIILTAINNNGLALDYANKETWKDKEIMINAILKGWIEDMREKDLSYRYAAYFDDEHLTSDYEFRYFAGFNSEKIDFIKENFKDDIDILEAINLLRSIYKFW